VNTLTKYFPWVTAGNHLQTAGAWIGAHWVWLAVAASAIATIASATHRHLRQKGDQQ